MPKEEMIRQILKGWECDAYSMSPAEREQELKNEYARLKQITFSEVEELYYTGQHSASLLPI